MCKHRYCIVATAHWIVALLGKQKGRSISSDARVGFLACGANAADPVRSGSVLTGVCGVTVIAYVHICDPQFM